MTCFSYTVSVASASRDSVAVRVIMPARSNPELQAGGRFATDFPGLDQLTPADRELIVTYSYDQLGEFETRPLGLKALVARHVGDPDSMDGDTTPKGLLRRVKRRWTLVAKRADKFALDAEAESRAASVVVSALAADAAAAEATAAAAVANAAAAEGAAAAGGNPFDELGAAGGGAGGSTPTAVVAGGRVPTAREVQLKADAAAAEAAADVAAGAERAAAAAVAPEKVVPVQSPKNISTRKLRVVSRDLGS